MKEVLAIKVYTLDEAYKINPVPAFLLLENGYIIPCQSSIVENEWRYGACPPSHIGTCEGILRVIGPVEVIKSETAEYDLYT